MIVLRVRQFSSKILNTNAPGFIKGRKYDMDMDRLSRGEYKNQLNTSTLDLSRELRDMNKELNRGLMGKWGDTD
jgi:hypothetical protein